MTFLDNDVLPSDTDPKAKPLGRRAARSTIEWAVIIGAALVVAFLVKTFLIQAFYIPSASMDPELEIGDRVLVNKLSYRVGEINRGDIVVFDRPECDTSDPTIKDLIKRVIAVGGERVEARDGRVRVDGEAIEEPYLAQGQRTLDFGPVTVPDGHIWVMGDNRENSKDSRFLCDGTTPIAEDAVVGRAFVLVWPFGKFELL